MTIDVSDGDDLGPVFYYNGCFQVDDVCFNPTYMSEIPRHSTASIDTIITKAEKRIQKNLLLKTYEKMKLMHYI